MRERYTQILKSPTNPASFDELDSLFGQIGFIGPEPDKDHPRYVPELKKPSTASARLHVCQRHRTRPDRHGRARTLSRSPHQGRGRHAGRAHDRLPPRCSPPPTATAAAAHARAVIHLQVDGFTFSFAAVHRHPRRSPTWTSSLGAGNVDVTPRTRCLLEEDLFVATPADPGEYSTRGGSCAWPIRPVSTSCRSIPTAPASSPWASPGTSSSRASSRARTRPPPTPSPRCAAPACRSRAWTAACSSLRPWPARARSTRSAVGHQRRPAPVPQVSGNHARLVRGRVGRQERQVALALPAHRRDTFISLNEEVPVPPTDEAPVTPLPTQWPTPPSPRTCTCRSRCSLEGLEPRCGAAQQSRS